MTEPIDHKPTETRTPQQQADSRRRALYGIALFLIYLAFYAGFVLLNAFWPEVMDEVLAAGVNLAIWYGFALIVLALVLALVYDWLCQAAPPDGPNETANQEGQR
ncbi:MAG: DUF485 domain-containing protein [Gemmataceae bacterium]|nr:DUF485 domain-containing protein [Gemmataceae bacterium]